MKKGKAVTQGAPQEVDETSLKSQKKRSEPNVLSAQDLAGRLREDIVTGRLVPNQRLVEADIAEDYGASRGNIRVALSELSVEGLVERVQNRGARVRAVSVEEAVEITEVRAAVEALCAKKAAERITESQQVLLQEIGRKMVDAVGRGDRELYSMANEQLHREIIEISGQRTAAETIRRLQGQAVRYQFRLSRQHDRPKQSLPQHLAIIDAICARDGSGAAEAMNAHLASVAEAIVVAGAD
ncbi:GntR family transcriptional regulator [Corynebacterium glutamicum]|uniref:GntR family transcriptional regulator n=1 Tax=Corynebacterium glutamicum TaxID=1718 RepID=UPI0009C0B0A1|nr:GntR family transcriptional regulator [Corynebacterium glutamicum]